jgi:hypothetical protein
MVQITDINSTDDIYTEIIAELLGEWFITERDIDEECKICLESMYNEYTITTSCRHTFHRNCILKTVLDYSRNKCPLCNTTFDFLIKNKITNNIIKQNIVQKIDNFSY